MSFRRIPAFALMILLLLPAAAHADNLLGNLPTADDPGTTATIGTYLMVERRAAVKFTTPNQPYLLDDIQLRLALALTEGPPVVTLHEDDAVDDTPGTLFATLTNPPLENDKDTYRFSTGELIRLEANTTYWFQIDHADQTGGFDWKNSNPAILPSGIGTFDVMRVFTKDSMGEGWTNVTEYGGFQINGTPVVHQPDLAIGEMDKPGRAKRDNVYNTTGGGQKYVVKLTGRKKQKGFLFVQNDANESDTVSLSSNVPRKKLYRYKIFRITGGKANITAAVKSGAGFAFPDLAPGERITCLIELKGKNRRGNHSVKYTGTSAKNGARLDVNQLKVKARN